MPGLATVLAGEGQATLINDPTEMPSKAGEQIAKTGLLFPEERKCC